MPAIWPFRRLTMPWIPGAAPSIDGKAWTSECPRAASRRARRLPRSRDRRATFAAIACGSPPRSTRMLNGFITPGLIRRRAARLRPAIASPLPGKFFSCDSFGVSRARARPGRRRSPARRWRRPRAPEHEARPASPDAVLGMAGSTRRFGITRPLLMRAPSTESIAGRSVIAAVTETIGISIPPMPIERMNGSGSTTSESRPTATVEPDTITDRPAWVIVSTSAVSTSRPLAARRGSGRSSAARSRSRLRARRARSGTGR